MIDKKTWAYTCPEIVNFLILNHLNNVSNTVDELYKVTVDYWNHKYILSQEFADKIDFSYITKEILYPVYEKQFSEKQRKMKKALTVNELTEVNYLLTDNMKSCKATKYCMVALESLIMIWKKLASMVMIPHVADLGSLIANFNFLLELEDNFEMNRVKDMHQQISNVVSQLYPGLLPRKDIFLVDVMGLLGYVTTFHVDNLGYGPKIYNYITEDLLPLHSIRTNSQVLQSC